MKTSITDTLVAIFDSSANTAFLKDFRDIVDSENFENGLRTLVALLNDFAGGMAKIMKAMPAEAMGVGLIGYVLFGKGLKGVLTKFGAVEAASLTAGVAAGAAFLEGFTGTINKSITGDSAGAFKLFFETGYTRRIPFWEIECFCTHSNWLNRKTIPV